MRTRLALPQFIKAQSKPHSCHDFILSSDQNVDPSSSL